MIPVPGALTTLISSAALQDFYAVVGDDLKASPSLRSPSFHRGVRFWGKFCRTLNPEE